MKSDTLDILRNSFNLIASRDADVTAIFYDRLFEVAPGVRGMFPDDLTEQKQKLLAALVQIVESVDKPERLIPYLSRMGERHSHYGAKPEHYDVVGQVLLWTFERVLGPDYTLEVHQAWAEAYGAVAKIMREATPPSLVVEPLVSA